MGELHKLDNQSQLIVAIKTNDSVALKALYISNYAKIESLVLSNSGTKEDAKDVYQDAFIVVWNNIKNNTFIPLNESAIQGYLYTISKNKWMDIIKSSRFKKTKSTYEEKSFAYKSDEVHEDDSSNEKMKATMDAFKNLGEPCKQLLTSFYYEKKTLKDIASALNIEENTVRNKKYRCMEKLRTMVLPQKT
uniref:RNA polymerase sigma factor n=1 Tax=Mariniflexile sp. TaxID=1979402 RepID=UPI004047BD9D